MGGLVAAAYNRSPRHALIIVELPEPAAVGEAPAPITEIALPDGSPGNPGGPASPPLPQQEPVTPTVSDP
jgi:hypothetical protein